MGLMIEKRMGEKTTLILKGRLDTTTTPEFEEVLKDIETETKELILDFSEVQYVSSAGLRAILKVQKLMNTKGSMKLLHVNDSIMDIFEITGFIDFLTIE